MADDDFIPCYIKELPERLQPRAAEVAARIYPLNAPAVPPPAEGIAEPARLALVNAKYWGKEPRTLTVSFLEDYPPEVKERILRHMNAWDCCVKFQLLPPGQVGNVRITLRGQGYWSYLGTDILTIPPNQPTMCLQNMDRQSEAELTRVVRHETGHTLGFPHEHLRREIVQRINPQAAYAFFGGPPNFWPPNQTYSNVLTPLNPNEITTTPAEEDSIMCYQLPGQIMYNGIPVKGGNDINAQDADFCRRLYPKPAPPPPVTPSPPVVQPPPVPTAPPTCTCTCTCCRGSGTAGSGSAPRAHVAEDWGPEQDVDMAQIMRHVLPATAR